MEKQYPSKGTRGAMEQELLRGRGIANQLVEVLAYRSNNNSHHNQEELMLLPLAQDLVQQILRSFTNTLLLLNTNNSDDDASDEKMVVPITIRDFSSSPIGCQKQHDEGCNTKNRRGRHKRKSTVPTWEKDSPILIEDGHAWRKYGQKKTMDSEYLRNYYRCTHKYEQGCPAIRQVQRIQEDPPLYRTTYFGHHTCKSTFDREIILESDNYFSGSSSMYLSFNNSIPSSKKHSFSAPILESSAKQEPVEMIIHDDDDHVAQNDHQFSSSDDYFLLGDYEVDFNYASHVAMLSSTDASVPFDNVYGYSSVGF